ncbi:MAG: flagellar biosynthetic protein FliO [Treponema sp.]|nr:flagellar biosynthetic protein FliO [Candidatus Treponema equi]
MNYSKARKWTFLVLIMFCAGFLFAQNATSDTSTSSQTQTLTKSQIEESQFTFDSDVNEQSSAAPRQVSGFWAFVRMIIVLAIVIGVIYFIFRLMKKSIAPGAENDPFLRKVAGITLSPGKSVQVVTLIDKAYLVGVSENSVNLISEIDDKELINAMNLHSDKTTNQFKAKSFAEVLEMFMGKKVQPENNESKKEKKSAGVFDSSTQNLIDALKNRRMGSGEEE